MSAVSALQKDTRLLAYYVFQTGRGTNLLHNVAVGDPSDTDTTHKGAGVNGRIHGAGWTDTGRFDTPALRFRGSAGHYVRIPTREGLAPPSKMTLMAWVKCFGTAGQILNKWDIDWSGGGALRSGRERAYLLKINGGQLSFSRNASRNYSSSRTYSVASDRSVPTDEWTLLAATYDGSELHVWIDGEEVGKANGSKDDLQKDFGYVLMGRYFDGLIDEVAILGRAMTGGELRTLYQAGMP